MKRILAASMLVIALAACGHTKTQTCVDLLKERTIVTDKMDAAAPDMANGNANHVSDARYNEELTAYNAILPELQAIDDRWNAAGCPSPLNP